MQSNNKSVMLANLRILEFVASKLGEIRDDVVFIGGCTTGLFITDPEFPDVRYTVDVDCIVDVISLNQYYQLEKKLAKQGFKKSLSEEVICRWYKRAIAASIKHHLNDKIAIKIVTAPYFLATKLEAFKTRGKSDYYVSHDFEDIVSILDGRVEIVEEIHTADSELRDHLINSFTEINNSLAFKGAIPGHFVQYGSYADGRINIVEQKIKDIISG